MGFGQTVVFLCRDLIRFTALMRIEGLDEDAFGRNGFLMEWNKTVDLDFLEVGLWAFWKW